jgi:hypothetical protein
MTSIPIMRRLLFALTLTVLGLTATVALAERPEPTVHGVFDGDEMYTVLEPDVIPAIRNPEYVTGKEAAAQMSGDEHIMGLADGDDAVCWSTWQLDSHEIVNTEFAEAPIAAAW